MVYCVYIGDIRWCSWDIPTGDHGIKKTIIMIIGQVHEAPAQAKQKLFVPTKFRLRANNYLSSDERIHDFDVSSITIFQCMKIKREMKQGNGGLCNRRTHECDHVN